MDREINLPGNGNIVVDRLNGTEKLYLKDKWNLLVNEKVTTHQILE